MLGSHRSFISVALVLGVVIAGPLIATSIPTDLGGRLPSLIIGLLEGELNAQDCTDSDGGTGACTAKQEIGAAAACLFPVGTPANALMGDPALQAVTGGAVSRGARRALDDVGTTTLAWRAGSAVSRNPAAAFIDREGTATAECAATATIEWGDTELTGELYWSPCVEVSIRIVACSWCGCSYIVDIPGGGHYTFSDTSAGGGLECGLDSPIRFS